MYSQSSNKHDDQQSVSGEPLSGFSEIFRDAQKVLSELSNAEGYLPNGETKQSITISHWLLSLIVTHNSQLTQLDDEKQRTTGCLTVSSSLGHSSGSSGSWFTWSEGQTSYNIVTYNILRYAYGAYDADGGELVIALLQLELLNLNSQNSFLQQNKCHLCFCVRNAPRIITYKELVKVCYVWRLVDRTSLFK